MPTEETAADEISLAGTWQYPILRHDPAPELYSQPHVRYLLEDDEPRVHWRMYVALVLLVITAGALVWHWQTNGYPWEMLSSGRAARRARSAQTPEAVTPNKYADPRRGRAFQAIARSADAKDRNCPIIPRTRGGWCAEHATCNRDIGPGAENRCRRSARARGPKERSHSARQAPGGTGRTEYSAAAFCVDGCFLQRSGPALRLRAEIPLRRWSAAGLRPRTKRPSYRRRTFLSRGGKPAGYHVCQRTLPGARSSGRPIAGMPGRCVMNPG